MAGSVNKVTLVGNLGKDPETRSMQDGTKIVNLTLATSETWNDKQSGERKEKVEWHRVVIFNDRIADVADRYLKKGAKVYIEGALQTRKWTDQSGVERYSTEVVIGRFKGELVMLSDGNGGERSQGNGQGNGQSNQRSSGRDNGGRDNGGGRGQEQARSQRWDGNGQPQEARGGGRQATNRQAPPADDLDDEIPF